MAGEVLAQAEQVGLEPCLTLTLVLLQLLDQHLLEMWMEGSGTKQESCWSIRPHLLLRDINGKIGAPEPLAIIVKIVEDLPAQLIGTGNLS